MTNRTHFDSYIRKTDVIFKEISTFYGAFNSHPDEGLAILLNNPKTKEWIENVRNERKRRKENPINPPIPYIYNGLISVSQSKRFSPFLPLEYKISGRDVINWLYLNRIILLQFDLLEPFNYEFGDLEKDKKEYRSIHFRETLDSVLNELNGFLRITVENFTATVTVEHNWNSIYKELQEYIPVIQEVVRSYDNLIKIYLPEEKRQIISDEEPTPIEVERILIIHLLQEHSQFPDYKLSKAGFWRFITALTGIKDLKSKKLFDRAKMIMDEKKENLEAQQLPHFRNALNNVKGYFSGIGDSEVVNKIEERLSQLVNS